MPVQDSVQGTVLVLGRVLDLAQVLAVSVPVRALEVLVPAQALAVLGQVRVPVQAQGMVLVLGRVLDLALDPAELVPVLDPAEALG